ncbi:MAG: hypothetical protein ACI9MB_001159 [Verrucomicrobiales bacterium]|jgi:hypothetical protein
MVFLLARGRWDLSAGWVPELFSKPLKLATLACVVLVSCGGEKQQQTSLIEEPMKLEARNELIALRLKEIERADRLPVGAGKLRALTALPIESRVPSAEAGSDWSEEALAQSALEQLQALAEGKVAGALADGFQCSQLNPPGESVDLGKGLKMATALGGDLQDCSGDDLLKRLRELGKLKVKVVQLEATGRNFTTRVRAEADRDGAEYSAVWECRWQANGEGAPSLVSLQLETCETVSSSGEWFIDVTRAAIGANRRFDAQVMRSIEYWSQRVTRIGDLAMSGHHGIAVGDVNGDGLEDVYACDGGSLPNQLYVQQPDGTAKEVAAEAGVAWLEDSRSALLVDLDNDGDQDLVVATIAMIVFAENDGAGKFELRGGFPGAPYPFSLSAADVDSDGDLDLYACVYSAGDESVSGKRGFEAASPIPFNDANNGGCNVLLANLGDFQFGDVTAQVGLEQNNTRWSFAAAWEDMDRDGDPDLYVANDFGRNCLYRNDSGRFTDIAAQAGVEDIGAGMSVAWGDFNRDGAADLQVGNMFSAAGRRVGFQRDYADDLQRMARGNSLFAADGSRFNDVSLDAGITVGGWAWSSALADLDNDGWQDIVAANGYLTNTRDDDL